MKPLRSWAPVLGVVLGFAAPVSASSFDSGEAGFTVTFHGVQNRYRVLGLFALPGEQVRLLGSESLSAQAERGVLEPDGPHAWLWTAPKTPGPCALALTAADGRTMTLNAFVMRSATEIENGTLDGYRIGEYPTKPYKGLAAYHAPRGFVEVTPETAGLAVSPHFTLGQFVCKQATKSASKFIVLREALLVKLERILRTANEAGHRADTFHVMSGYRTPFYNKAIGNVPNSRHVYGGAADIFIDVDPKDGAMDDLNRDGTVDRADAAVLYDLVERLSREEGWRHPGGLGEYGVSHTHGPFVHVDARGQRARWGRK